MKRPSNYWELVLKYYPNYDTCPRIKLTKKLFVMIRDKIDPPIHNDDTMQLDDFCYPLGITKENIARYYDESCDFIYAVTLDSMLEKLVLHIFNTDSDAVFMLDNMISK